MRIRVEKQNYIQDSELKSNGTDGKGRWKYSSSGRSVESALRNHRVGGARPLAEIANSFDRKIIHKLLTVDWLTEAVSGFPADRRATRNWSLGRESSGSLTEPLLASSITRDAGRSSFIKMLREKTPERKAGRGDEKR